MISLTIFFGDRLLAAFELEPAEEFERLLQGGTRHLEYRAVDILTCRASGRSRVPPHEGRPLRSGISRAPRAPPENRFPVAALEAR